MSKIILEKEKCIGCGTCSVVCPSFFEMGGDGRANLKEGVEKEKVLEKEVSDTGCANEAMQSCPVGCIHVEEN